MKNKYLERELSREAQRKFTMYEISKENLKLLKQVTQPTDRVIKESREELKRLDREIKAGRVR